MRAAAILGIPLLCAVLQVTVVRLVSIGEAHPDLLAPVVVSWSLIAGAAALAHELLRAIVLAIVGVSLPPLGVLLAGGVGTAVYTGSLALLAYPLLRLLHRRTAREPAFDW